MGIISHHFGSVITVKTLYYERLVTLVIFLYTVQSGAEDQTLILCHDNSALTHNVTLVTPSYPDWYSTPDCACHITAKSEAAIRITFLHEQWANEDPPTCDAAFYIQYPDSETRICPWSRKSERRNFILFNDESVKLSLRNNGDKGKTYFRTSAKLTVAAQIKVLVDCLNSEEGLIRSSNTFPTVAEESSMATGAIVAGVIAVVVGVLLVLACCAFFVYKYFWKAKKNKKDEANKGEQNEKSAGKPPASTIVNMQQINLGFDKSSEQGSFDNDPPTDSSYNSNHVSPNVSYGSYHSQSESAGTSDSEYGRDHTLSSSTEHSRKSIRFAENLPTLSGDQPPEDGRAKIGRATVTLIPPPPPRGKKPLPPIEVPRSYVKQARKAGYHVSGSNPRVNMNPMPTGRVVQRKHSSGSRPPSLNGSVRGASPHRNSGRRSNSRSPNRSSGRSPHRNSGRRSRSHSSNRLSGASFDSNYSGASPQVATTAPEFPILDNVTKQAQDHSVGMHPAMTDNKKEKPKSEHFTHIVAGNSAIQAQPVGEPQGLQRNTQQRRSRSRKRRPRNEGQGSEENSLSESGSQDIVPAVSGSVDSPPTMQMVAPGGKQTQQSHTSPLAQSSPQTQRYRKTPENSLDRIDLHTPQQSFDSLSGELRPRMPYDYFPPQSPGDALGGGKQQLKTPRSATSYQPEAYVQQTRAKQNAKVQGEKISDPDSNYFSGSSGDKLDSDVSPQHGGQKGRLVFQGVENPAFQPEAQPQQIKPKKRRRKSQNRGKNTAGSVDVSGVHNVQSNGPYNPQMAHPPYPNPALGYSNDSMIYMDEATDTDMYTISSKKALKAKSSIAIQGSKSGETEL